MTKLFTTLMIALWSFSAMADVPVHEDRNEAEYNNQYSVVLNGFDPVSYFPEGGGTPLKGKAEYIFVYGTREYHFASEMHLVMFKSNPLKYEPTYGSWCAWAMSLGKKAPIIPEAFTLKDGRLHVFASFGAKANFDMDKAANEMSADGHWFDFSGEVPRL